MPDITEVLIPAEPNMVEEGVLNEEPQIVEVVLPGPQGIPGVSTPEIKVHFSGGGLDLAVGDWCDFDTDFAGEFLKWTLYGDDDANQLQLDIRKTTYDNFPPEAGDSICAGNYPTLNGAVKARDEVMSGWNKTIAPGDTFRVVILSRSGIGRAFLALKVRKTSS